MVNAASSPGARRLISTHVAVITLAVVVSCFLVLQRLTEALGQWQSFSGEIADGPMQMLNWLRRLSSGQRAGTDFLVFHGIGQPVLHWPIFHLLGASVNAVQVTRSLTGPFLMTASLMTLGWVIFKSIRVALLFPVGAVLCIYIFSPLLLLQPDNSQIAARAWPFFLVAAIAYWISKHQTPSWMVVLASAAAAGCSVNVAPEFGVATTAGLLCAIVFHLWTSRISWPAAMRMLGLWTSSWILALSASGIAITGSAKGLVDSLNYSFVTIPASEPWYFGGFPNGFVSWSHPRQATAFLLVLSLSIVTAVCCFLASRRGEIQHRVATTVVYLVSGSCVAMSLSIAGYISWEHLMLPILAPVLGLAIIYVQRSTQSLTSWPRIVLIAAYLALWCYIIVAQISTYTVVAALAGAITLYIRSNWSPPPTDGISISRIARALAFPLVVGAILNATETGLPFGTLAGSARTLLGIDPSPPAISIKGVGRVNSLLAAQFSTADQAYSRAGCEPKCTTWSIYSGLLQMRSGTFMAPADYIIHALSKDQIAGYLNSFLATKPDIVETPNHFDYNQWLMLEDWWFFKPLVENYHPTEASKLSVFWARRTAAMSFQANLQIEKSGAVYLIPNAPANALLSCKLTYRASALPLTLPAERFFVHIYGSRMTTPLTLDGRQSSVIFPILTSNSSEIITLDPAIEGLVYGQLTLTDLSCQGTLISTDDANGLLGRLSRGPVEGN